MEDYQDSALRHYNDASLLRTTNALDNAGHLIGFAAECAIKYRITNLRPEENSPYGHLPDLLIAARKHLGPRGGYAGMYNLIKADIFKTWHVNRRYHRTGGTTNEELDDWFDKTKRLFASASIRISKNHA